MFIPSKKFQKIIPNDQNIHTSKCDIRLKTIKCMISQKYISFSCHKYKIEYIYLSENVKDVHFHL